MENKAHSKDELERSILNSWREVQQASAELYQFKEILNKLCTNIKDKFQFDFTAIQLIRKDIRMIEAAHVSGVARKWTGRSRHNLDEPPQLRDIQTDIALADPPRAETISGWDERFDEWIFDICDHQDYVRLFLPLLLVRNEHFDINENWWKDKGFKWVYNDEIVKTGKRKKKEGRVRKYVLHGPENTNFEIFGTLETGYNDPRKKITPYQVTEVLNFVSAWAIKLQKSLLPYVLQRIVENAIHMIHGDSASLHFQEISNKSRYVYEVGAGKIPHGFLQNYPPREGGIGKKAIENDEVQIIPDATKGQDKLYLKKNNPGIYNTGIRTIIAFPLLVNEKQNGVLYIHFRKHRHLAKADLEQVRHFADQVCTVIRNAFIFMQTRDRARQLRIMHSIVQSLVSRKKRKELLNQIAWSTLNMTGSDIVTIYEYRENEYTPIANRFQTPPAVAGRFIDSSKMRTRLFSDDAPILLLQNQIDIYIENDPVTDKILNKPGRKRVKLPFVKRENIKSVAGILLKDGLEIVGVMFINYRRHHNFDDKEKELIKTFSSYAAIAIQNQRELARTQESLETIAHQLEYPLSSIMITLSSHAIKNAPHEIIHQIDKAKAWAESAYALCNGMVLSFTKEAGGRPDTGFGKGFNAIKEIEKLRELVLLTIRPEKTKIPIIKTQDCLVVKMNRQIFLNVMYTLVHNAIKYSDDNSKVTIKCLGDPENCVTVTSCGEPIEQDEKELIFKKFRRGKIVGATGRHHSGVGLGLWVARELMRAAGGDVDVKLSSDNPRISEFIVSFPV